MKYVIFERCNLLVPVILPEHATHAEVKMEGYQVHSAGFFHIGSNKLGGIITVLPDISDSLGIGPKPGDKELLMAVLGGYGMYMFMAKVGE